MMNFVYGSNYGEKKVKYKQEYSYYSWALQTVIQSLIFSIITQILVANISRVEHKKPR